MSWRLAVALAIMLASSLTQGLNFLLLVPLLHLVGIGTQTGPAGGIDHFVASIFGRTGLSLTLGTLLPVFVLVTAVQSLLIRQQEITNMRLQAAFAAHLRKQLYRSIAHADWLFFSRSRSSNLVHVLTNELDRVSVATQSLLLLASSAALTCVYLGFAIRLSLPLTALVMATSICLLLLLHGKVGVSREAGENISASTSEFYLQAIDNLASMKTAKSYDAQEQNSRAFSAITDRMARTYVEATESYASAHVWFDVGAVVILSLILYVSVQDLALPTASILLLLFLFARLVPSFSGLQHNYQQLVSLMPSYTRYEELLAESDAAAEPVAQSAKAIEPRHAISLRRVTFAYSEQPGSFALENIDLVIPLGSTTAIVGPSGAGKSTIADLLMGLLIPNSGQVLIDDVPLSVDYMRSWRSQIGYVSQDIFLFHGSVRSNLEWAHPGASDDDLVRVLQMASAEDFTLQLPTGLDTVIGERGVTLSGGERQRLALARALLRRPSLLILDEATSALDSHNERNILRAIDLLHGQTTIVVITHRLSTVFGADNIHVLDHGTLAETGTWKELASRENGTFRALCEAQGLAS